MVGGVPDEVFVVGDLVRAREELLFGAAGVVVDDEDFGLALVLKRLCALDVEDALVLGVWVREGEPAERLVLRRWLVVDVDHHVG